MVGTTEELLNLNLTLELHHTIKYGLWTWRTSRNIHVYRNNLRNTAYHVVRVLERTARDSATTYSYNILRLSHLVVQTLEDRSHLVGDGTGTHYEVGLTWRVTCYLEAEAREVVAGATHCHKLDTTARCTKG